MNKNLINKIYQGDSLEVLRTFPDNCINTCITSPPYFGLRDYGIDGQIGLEETPDEYVSKLVEVFREVRRALKNDGTLWLNLGDSYSQGHTGRDDQQKFYNKTHGYQCKSIGEARKRRLVDGLKPKDLIGIPWRVAFALQDDGWYLRQDIIWSKPNPMPESVTDRCTKSHEYIFLFSKSQKYYYDNEAIKEKSIYGIDGVDSRPAGVVRNREYGYDSKENNYPEAYLKPDKRGGKGKISYEGKRTQREGRNGQQSFVSIPNMRNKRSVWAVTTRPYSEAHFATFPEELIQPCVLAGSPENGIVLDPFMGAGTTALVAKKYARSYVGIELNQEYIDIANKRLKAVEFSLFANTD